MAYSYKRLTRSDVVVLKELLEVFAEAFDEPETYQGNVPRDTYLESWLNKDNIIVLVAYNKDGVVGGLVAYVLDKFEQERKEIYIYDLAVSKTHRRQGLATGLICNLKQIGKDMGAYIIFVQADKVDTPAIKLYESLGTWEDVLNFDIKVDLK
jgi:aminoglycoside 3-N-acetyltransferase I